MAILTTRHLHAAVIIDSIREAVIMLSARGHLTPRSRERILVALTADAVVTEGALALFASEPLDATAATA
jgi:DNA-binding FadR family transcriptional regulator